MKTLFPSEHKHKTSPDKVRILRVYVGQDQEVGVVFGFKNPSGKGVKVRGQRKRFGNEKKKLDFLAELQESGFTRFVQAERDLDPEKMVFEVMTSLQAVPTDTGETLARI